MRIQKSLLFLFTIILSFNFVYNTNNNLPFEANIWIYWNGDIL